MSNNQAVRRNTGIEDVALSVATRLGSLLSGLAIQSLLAYALLPTGRGEFAICIMFAAFAGVLLTPGVDAGSQYFVMAKKISVSQGISVSLTICLIGSGLSVALTIPLIDSNIAFFQKADSKSFYLALIFIPVSTFGSATQHLLLGLRRFAQIALFSLIQTAANGFVLVVLLISIGLDVGGALVAASTGHLVMVVLCLFDLRRSSKATWEWPSWSSASLVLRYGLKHYVARIGWSVDVRIGVLLLGLMASRTEVGLFAVASALMAKFFLISNAVFQPLLTRAITHEAGRPDLVAFCSRIATWTTGFALVLFLIFAVPLMRLLLSEQFLPLVPLLRIIAVGVVTYAGAVILNAYFRATNRPGTCSWAIGIGLASTFLSVPLLYPVVGIYASAWGMTIGFVTRSAFLSVAYYRMSHTHPAISCLYRRGDFNQIRAFTKSAIYRARQSLANRPC